MKKDLKSESDKLLNEIRQASIQCLETENDIDDDNDEIETENREILQADIKKFTKLVKRLIKQTDELKQIAEENKDNVALKQYIRTLEKIKETQLDIENAKKGYLYESAIKLPENQFESRLVQVLFLILSILQHKGFEREQSILSANFRPALRIYNLFYLHRAVFGYLPEGSYHPCSRTCPDVSKVQAARGSLAALI